MNLDYLTIILIVIIFSLVYYLSSRFLYDLFLKKKNSSEIDGREIATRIISGEGLTLILSKSHKNYQTYIDINKNTLVLSHKILSYGSITSLAVVGYELGVARAVLKYRILWILKEITNSLILIASSVGTLLIFLSLILSDVSMYNLGIVIFAISLLLVILTIPFSIVTSIHAKNILNRYSLVSEIEKSDVNILLIFLSLASLNLLVSLMVIVIDYILESLDIRIK